MSNNVIHLRRNFVIGSLEAETDIFLNECFVDNGELSILKDVDDTRNLVVARTGAGKSALLLKFQRENANTRSVDLQAHYLQLLENTNIRSICEKMNVSLDRFYIILWEHIFLIELIKQRYVTQNRWQQAIDVIRGFVTANPARSRALEYLSTNSGLWKSNEEVFQEVTSSFEEKASAELKSKGPLSAEVIGENFVGEEQRRMLLNKVNHVIDSLQLKELNEIFELLNSHVFDNNQNKYYLVIDKLDEEWVRDNPLRLGLIKSMIETIKKFRRVKNVKIIAAIRTDLFKQITNHVAASKQQREKYESICLPLHWNELSLKQVLDLRISYLFKRQYQKKDVTLDTLLPENICSDAHLKYLLDRTFYRPREAISFINECIVQSDGQSCITEQSVRLAEPNFLDKRYRALEDEWSRLYPNLPLFIKILEGKKEKFSFSEISQEEVNKIIGDLVDFGVEDAVYNYANAHSDESLIPFILKVLYEVGVIGVVLPSVNRSMWSFMDTYEFQESEIRQDSLFEVHRFLHLKLHIQPALPFERAA